MGKLQHLGEVAVTQFRNLVSLLPPSPIPPWPPTSQAGDEVGNEAGNETCNEASGEAGDEAVEDADE